jgi:predicted tellurium resistance membrane protein TerC
VSFLVRRHFAIGMTNQPLILIVASCVYLVAMVVTAYLTRATSRRVKGALIGGAAVALVGVGVECLAHAMGWWRYPNVETPYGPPLMYPVVILLFAALSLIGLRVTRRFSWRGQVAFLGAVTVLGHAA